MSKADKLTRSGTIDVAYSIYPLYSFQANGSSAGDYYIVEGTFTVHNDQMYNGSWTKKHGGVKSHLCGFYLKKFEVGNTLCATDGTVLPGVNSPARELLCPRPRSEPRVIRAASSGVSEALSPAVCWAKTRRFPGR